jgi:hypothetical protein
MIEAKYLDTELILTLSINSGTSAYPGIVAGIYPKKMTV